MKTKEQLLQEHYNIGGLSGESFIAGFDACLSQTSEVGGGEAAKREHYISQVDAFLAGIQHGRASERAKHQLKSDIKKWYDKSYQQFKSPVEKLQYLIGLSEISWDDMCDAHHESIKLLPEINKYLEQERQRSAKLEAEIENLKASLEW